MKAFVIAFLIFVLLLVGTGIYITWLDGTVAYFAEESAAMSDAVMQSDWERCRETMTDFFEEWNKAYPRLEFFIHHKDVDEISRLLYELRGYLELKNKESFLVKNGILQNMLLMLPNGERLTLENILRIDTLSQTIT